MHVLQPLISTMSYLFFVTMCIMDPTSLAVRLDEDEDMSSTPEVDKKLAAALTLRSVGIESGVQGADMLDFKEFPKGPQNFPVRGITGKQAYKAGDQVLKLPGELCMWTNGKRQIEHFRTNGVPAQLLQPNCGRVGSEPDEDCARVRLVANLIALKRGHNTTGPAGPPLWNAYVNFLPDHAGLRMYHPGVGDEQLLQTFEQLSTVRDIRKEHLLQSSRYEQYKAAGGTGSEDDFEWGNYIFHAYGWPGPYGQGELLAPLGDTFNAAEPENQNVNDVDLHAEGDSGKPDDKTSFDKSGFFLITATKDIPAGGEIVGKYNTPADDQWAGIWGILLRGRKADPADVENAVSLSQCKELLANVGSSVTSLNSPCNPPAKFAQSAGAFCTMARLVYEHCDGPAIL
jgi:hypothetical protein